MKTMLIAASVLALSSVSAFSQSSPSYLLDSYTYAALDADDDNLITLDELQSAIPTITAGDIARIDANNDGFVGYREYSSSPVIVRYYDADAVTIPTTRTISVQRSYFTGIDRNRNGVIEEDEMMEVSSSFTPEIYVTLDEDEDGIVTYSELYDSDWFTDALDAETIITPAYVTRYYAQP